MNALFARPNDASTPRSVRPPPLRSPSVRPSSATPASVLPGRASRPAPRAIPRLRLSLQRLLQRLRNLNVTDFESGDRPPLRLEALASSVASDVRTILDDASAYYASEATATGVSAEHILDLTSIARMELSGLAGHIGRETGASAWQRIAVCDSVLHVSRRCLRALDVLIADAEGLPRGPDDSADETATAVQIRHVFLELHRAVIGDDLPDSDTIRPRLHAVGNCIARVLGRSVAGSIRVHDRYTMRSFQARIRESLLGTRSDDDAAIDDLTRVWQDLSNFTALLLDVNKREELRTHDRDATAVAIDAIREMPPAFPCPEAVIEALRPCEGRDPELDALITRGTTVGTMRQCLERVHATLGPAPPRSLNASSGTWSGIL